jgi:replicative DNA helicase
LGAILLDNDVLAPLSTLLTADAFYREPHRRLYRVMRSLYARGTPIDALTLTAALDRSGELDAVGGRVAINALLDVATSANVRAHAAIVRECAQRRRLIAHATAAVQEASRGHLPAAAIASQLAADLLPVAVDPTQNTGFQPVGATALLAEITTRAARGPVPFLSTPWPVLDAQTHGFRPGDLLIIGAVEKAGKSAIASAMAQHVALTLGQGVGYISAEMTRDTLVERWLASTANVPTSQISTGQIRDYDLPLVVAAARRLDAAPLWVDDEAMPSLEDILARAVELKTREPTLALFVVDFLQIVRHTLKGRRGDEELLAIAYALKGLAKRTGTVVVAPAQLNSKQIAQRPDKRPTPYDLQGGSGMLQACDFALLAYRPGMYDPNAPEVVELHVAASRRTATFTVHLEWRGETSSVR